MKDDYSTQSPKIKATLHWFDLPSRTVIELDKEFQVRILDGALKNLSGKIKLADFLGISRQQLRYYRIFKSNFTVRTLKRLARAAKISLYDVEKQITKVGRMNPICDPKLPFRLHSKEGVALRSIVNSEGHIPEQIGTSMHIRVPETDMLQMCIDYAKEIFGEFKVEIKKTKDKNTHEIFFPAVVADSLELSGLAFGRKSIKNFPVPKDIMLANKELKRIYLAWSFASEMECSQRIVKLKRYLNVSDILPNDFSKVLPEGMIFKNKIPGSILLLLSAKQHELLLGESILLAEFGIHTTPRITALWKAKNGRVSAVWTITITNRKGIETLRNHIRPPLEEKIEKLDKALSLYVRV